MSTEKPLTDGQARKRLSQILNSEEGLVTFTDHADRRCGGDLLEQEMNTQAEKKCRTCGSPMKSRTGDWNLEGLDNVVVRGVTYYQCENGHEDMTVVGLGPLMRKVAEMVARKASSLSVRERRFLRNALELGVSELADRMGVSRETVSRWESETSKQAMGGPAERLLRLMVVTGKATPDRIAADHFRALRRGDHWVVEAA